MVQTFCIVEIVATYAFGRLPELARDLRRSLRLRPRLLIVMLLSLNGFSKILPSQTPGLIKLVSVHCSVAVSEQMFVGPYDM